MKLRLLILLSTLSFSSIGQVREGYASSGEVNNWYQVYGTGRQAILIINGGPGMNSKGFESLAKEFANRYSRRVIIYDQRGTGNSILPELNSTTISIELMVHDIESIREEEALDAWLVFGQSFGGMLAAKYASQFPDRIEKLILSSSGGLSLEDLGEVDIMGRLTEVERDSFTYWNNKLQGQPQDERILLKRNTFLASAYVVGNDHVSTIAERLGEVNRQLNAMVFSDMRRINFNCANEIKEFNRSVLILIGDQDIVSLAAAKRTDALLENSLLVVVPKSGHYGWLENPEVYYGALDEFLER